jgi:hypothetical protein
MRQAGSSDHAQMAPSVSQVARTRPVRRRSLLDGGRAQWGVSAERGPRLPASRRETALTTDSTQSAPHLECQLAHVNYQLPSPCGLWRGDASSAGLPVLALDAALSQSTTHAVGAERVPSPPLAG